VGGPGNSLERNLNYCIEKDLSDISKKSGRTNVGFVGLFERHDRPQMQRRVRSLSLRLDRALLSPETSHIGLIDVSSIGRLGYTSHGLHLNSRGKRKLSKLIADRIKDEKVRKSEKIPVVISARATPFLW